MLNTPRPAFRSGQTSNQTASKTDALIQMAGTVSHELSNIFTALVGNLSMLEDAQGAEQAAVIADLLKAAQRGVDLTGRLQAFSGRQNLVRRNIEIHGIVKQAIAAQRHHLDGVSLFTAFLPEDLIVYIDARKLAETIAELMANARAAMPKSGGHLTITTRREIGPGGHAQAVLSLSDNGHGMTPEVAARATEPLFTTGVHGIKAGWGLSNCAGFVRQSGGRMTISSIPSQGTTVRLYLPLENG